MRVKVTLAGHLKEFFPALAHGVDVPLAQPATVAEILALLKVAPELPGAVLCRGVRVDRDFVPADGDELLIMSPLAGG